MVCTLTWPLVEHTVEMLSVSIRRHAQNKPLKKLFITCASVYVIFANDWKIRNLK